MMGALPRGACGVRILGTGSAVPDRRLTNDDFARMMDTSDEWITQRTGIKERRVLDLRTEGCSTLAQRALERAIDAAGINAEELDLVIVATVTMAASPVVEMVPGGVPVTLLSGPVVWMVTLFGSSSHRPALPRGLPASTEMPSTFNSWPEVSTRPPSPPSVPPRAEISPRAEVTPPLR